MTRMNTNNATRETWVLIYHALDSPQEPVAAAGADDMSVVVDADMFRQQLQCLSDMGRKIVPLQDLFRSTEEAPAVDPVVLTFDDGHKSNWSLALPALVEAGAVATFYVVADFVDKDPEYVTSAQLREMASHNMLIGSHGMTHRFLSELSPEEVHAELADSRARLEDIVGQPVLDLAIPGGHFNRSVTEEARQCGYRSVATCKVGVHRDGDDPLRLPRVEIRRGLSIEGFENTFSKRKLRQLQLIEAAKTCLRKTCGLRTYVRLRQVAHRYLRLNR